MVDVTVDVNKSQGSDCECQGEGGERVDLSRVQDMIYHAVAALRMLCGKSMASWDLYHVIMIHEFKPMGIGLGCGCASTTDYTADSLGQNECECCAERGHCLNGVKMQFRNLRADANQAATRASPSRPPFYSKPNVCTYDTSYCIRISYLTLDTHQRHYRAISLHSLRHSLSHLPKVAIPSLKRFTKNPPPSEDEFRLLAPSLC